MGQVMDKKYNGIAVPQGEKVTFVNGKPQCPNHPIIPFIEGDGTGADIWRASKRVFDAAVEKAYGQNRSIKWFEVLAGEKANQETKNWLPQDTLDAIREFGVAKIGRAHV